MSLEQEVGRIAGALERIATALENPVFSIPGQKGNPIELSTPTVEKKPKVKKEKVADPMPEPTPTSPVEQTVPISPVDVFDAGNEAPMTAEELRTLAQQVAAKMGDKILPFTAFVRDELCPRMGCQRLIEVHPDMTNEAAKMIKEWAKKVGINV